IDPSKGDEASRGRGAGLGNPDVVHLRAHELLGSELVLESALAGGDLFLVKDLSHLDRELRGEAALKALPMLGGGFVIDAFGHEERLGDPGRKALGHLKFQDVLGLSLLGAMANDTWLDLGALIAVNAVKVPDVFDCS